MKTYSQPIQYYLNDTLLGSTFVDSFSNSSKRIIAAKKIGIEYYDRFVIRPESKFPADSQKCIIDGKPLNDFDYVNK